MIGSSKQYDVIVVGAGTAGCALAARLSENANRSVLLLEAGPDYADFSNAPEGLRKANNASLAIMSGHSWWYAGIPNATQAAEFVLFPRGKVVGGTGAIDGRIHLWGLPDDYDAWAAKGCAGWAFEQVHPYLKRIERDLDFPSGIHGSDGPLMVRRYQRARLRPLQRAFFEACTKAGFSEDPDMNHPSSIGGVGCLPFAVIDGLRVNTATAFLGPARGRANLTIEGGVCVRRLLIEDGEVEGVEATQEGETACIRGGHVVVSAGSFASPQLLMVSGIGPAGHLRRFDIPVVRDLPGVGQNLVDHPLVNLVLRSQEETPDDTAPVLQAGLRVTAAGSTDRLDLHFLPFCPVSPAASQYGFDDESFIGTNLAVSLRAPQSAGCVQLASADPEVQPILDFRLLSEEWDLVRMRQGVRLAVELSRQSSYQREVRELVSPGHDILRDDNALDRWILSHVTAAHASGTCKMGTSDDTMAVIDPMCRVHGFNRLWVADASAMPSIVRANTAAATTLIAERAAGWIGRAA
jgi:choline dehydrogenase